jgi:hypothetical protein
MSDHHTQDAAPKVYGLIAEFDDPDMLCAATDKAYKAGYRTMDAFSPFPIHGLAELMGVNKTFVSMFTLIGGLTGACAGFGMQWFAMVIHMPFDIGGKPYFSWPSFIPITFELTILFGAFAALGSMLLLNGLPRLHHPIFNAKRFERASSDGFFLCIESNDVQYDTEKTTAFLNKLSPVEVSEVLEE